MRALSLWLAVGLVASSLLLGCAGLNRVGNSVGPAAGSNSGSASPSGTSSSSGSSGSSSGTSPSSPAPTPTPPPSQLPNAKFIYSTVASASAVYGALLHDDGSVTGIPFNDAYSTGAFVQRIAADAEGKFIFATASGPSERGNAPPAGTFSFIINQSDGTLSRTAPMLPDLGSIAARPDARFLYLADSSTLKTYAVDQQSGALTPAAPPLPFDGNQLLVNPESTLLFGVGHSGDGILVWQLDQQTGAPVPVIGSPFLSGSSTPGLQATTPDGKFLFVSGENQLITMRINPDGSLDQVSSLTTPTNDLVVEPTGRFAYGVTAASNNQVLLSGFRIDENGALTLLPGSPFDQQSEFLTLSVGPPGQYLYGLGGHFTYSIDQSTGAVTKIRVTEAVGGDIQSVIVP